MDKSVFLSQFPHLKYTLKFAYHILRSNYLLYLNIYKIFFQKFVRLVLKLEGQFILIFKNIEKQKLNVLEICREMHSSKLFHNGLAKALLSTWTSDANCRWRIQNYFTIQYHTLKSEQPKMVTDRRSKKHLRE